MNHVRTILIFFMLLFSVLSHTQNRIKSIYFENDQSVPTPYSQNQLQLFKKAFDNKEFTIIEICAYTDSIGSARYNDSLAKKRLSYVVDILDIPKNTSIKLKPYGLDRRNDVQNAKSWRRVDIYFSIDSNKISEYNSPIDSSYVLMEDEFIVPGRDSVYQASINRSIDISVPFILNIEFIEGTAKMDELSKRELKKFYIFMTDNKDLHGQIRGHVCCGNNMRISKMRARTVYRELIKMGIEKERLEYIGMSNLEPLVFPEKTNEDRQRNRRVDVKIQRNEQ